MWTLFVAQICGWKYLITKMLFIFLLFVFMTDACPVLCSGNGVYEGGVCKCFDSWKGAECSVQAHHCESCVHGRCIAGVCTCEDNWRGERCDEIDCPASDCSGHGLCQSGTDILCYVTASSNFLSTHWSCIPIVSVCKNVWMHYYALNALSLFAFPSHLATSQWFRILPSCNHLKRSNFDIALVILQLYDFRFGWIYYYYWNTFWASIIQELPNRILCYLVTT